MKIGYLCSDFDVPLYGEEGCSIHIRDFTDTLVEAGHDVFIVCAALGEPTGTPVSARVYHMEPKGLEARAWQLLEREPLIQDSHLERNLRLVLYNSRLACEGSGIIERERPDFLYERYALFGWGGVMLSRRHSIPLMLKVNAPLTVEQEGYRKFRLTTMADQMEGEIFRNADAVVVVSEWLKDWALSRGVDVLRVHVIPNGVSRRLFEQPSSAAEARAHYGLDGERVVGFVGSFQPWHDVSGLLHAFAELYAEDPSLRLLIVGDGSRRKTLEALAQSLGLSSAAIFVGHLPHDEVPNAIAAMDVAVSPSAADHGWRSPLKLFEYMAAGKAVLAADVGQEAQILKHGRTGWLYSSGNEAELAEGLRMLLYDESRAGALGAAAREQALHEHTWDAVVAEVVGLAGPLIEARARTSK